MFRCAVVQAAGQTSTAEVTKRDLRAELLAAEVEARDRKRKAEGQAPTSGIGCGGEWDRAGAG